MTTLLRHFLDFLAAAFAAAAAPAIAWWSPDLFVYALMVALVHVLVLAMPIYLFLRTRLRPTLPGILAGAFLIGALPILLLALAVPMPEGADAWGGGVQTVEDGVRTWQGWLELLTGAGWFGLFGACGGLAFWLVLRGELRG